MKPRTADRSYRAWVTLASMSVVALAAVLCAPKAQAGFISSVPTAQSYSVLFEGTTGKNLVIGNTTMSGNVGIGGSGVVQNNGASTVGGRMDFSAANSGQYNNNNGSNVQPSSVVFGMTGVTTALNQVNALSTALGVEAGTHISINGNTNIMASNGVLDGSGNYVFYVDSYSAGNGDVVNIVGDGSGRSVVLNFAMNSNVTLSGIVQLYGGLSEDQVLWNFTSSGKTVSLSNNSSMLPSFYAFRGVILAPNDVMQMVNSNLNGRFWGGDSQDMLVSGRLVGSGPSSMGSVPEPSSILLLATALLGLGFRRSRST